MRVAADSDKLRDVEPPINRRQVNVPGKEHQVRKADTCASKGAWEWGELSAGCIADPSSVRDCKDRSCFSCMHDRQHNLNLPGGSWIYPAWNFHLVTSLPAMTSGDMFCFSRKGGIGGGGWVHTKDADSMVVSGSTLKTPWLALSGSMLSSYAQTGWENSALALYGTHFRRGSICPSLGKRLLAECRDYCQLVNGWAWFESQTCRGWL